MRHRSVVKKPPEPSEEDLEVLAGIIQQFVASKKSERWVELEPHWFEFLTMLQNGAFYMECKNGPALLKRGCEVMREYYALKHHHHVERVSNVDYYVKQLGLE